MISNVVRIGIIGCGQIALQHIKRYAEIDGVEIVAVSDLKASARKEAAALAGGPEQFKQFRDLLKLKEMVNPSA